MKEMLHLSSTLPFQSLRSRPAITITIRCASSDSGANNKVSSRLSHVQHLLQQAEHRALSQDTGPTPKITLGRLPYFSHSSQKKKQNKTLNTSIFFLLFQIMLQLTLPEVVALGVRM